MRSCTKVFTHRTMSVRACLRRAAPQRFALQRVKQALSLLWCCCSGRKVKYGRLHGGGSAGQWQLRAGVQGAVGSSHCAHVPVGQPCGSARVHHLGAFALTHRVPFAICTGPCITQQAGLRGEGGTVCARALAASGCEWVGVGASCVCFNGKRGGGGGLPVPSVASLPVLTSWCALARNLALTAPLVCLACLMDAPCHGPGQAEGRWSHVRHEADQHRGYVVA